MSRRDANPMEILAPPHAGPSLFGVCGGGAIYLGKSSRAPLKNIDSPPFLFFFLETVGDEELSFLEFKFSFGTHKADSLVAWLVIISALMESSSYHTLQYKQIRK
jgi:hypothetical protein